MRVDPRDDELTRYVVRFYRYDPERRERRHQIVEAVDDEEELAELLTRHSVELRRRRGSGVFVDPREHYTGVLWEPGHRRRQRDARLLRRAVNRGVTVPPALLARLDLPPGADVSDGSGPALKVWRPVEAARWTGPDKGLGWLEWGRWVLLGVGAYLLVGWSAGVDYISRHTLPSYAPRIGTVLVGTVTMSATAYGSIAAGSQVVALFDDPGAAAVRAGDPATITVPDLVGLSLNGTVATIVGNDPAIGRPTAIRATIDLSGDVSMLHAGQSVKATVVTATLPNLLTVPTDAVHFGAGDSYVISADGRRIGFVHGAVGSDATEVRAGLSDGQQVRVSQ